jgi:uncharacterized protein
MSSSRTPPAAAPPSGAPPTPEFSVPVHDLDAGGREYHLPIRAAWLRGVLEETDVSASAGDGELDIRLSKSGKDVVVRGSLTAELMVPCSRCLELTPVAVRESLGILAVASPAPTRTSRAAKGGHDEEDLGPEEADVLPFDGDTLVLDDLVRDELLLGIPMIPLCSEGCPGISPKPEEGATDASIDPRLRPLLRLKSKA